MLTLDRKQLLNYFRVGWTVSLAYLIPQLVFFIFGRGNPFSVLIWTIAVLLYTFFVYLFDRFRLDVYHGEDVEDSQVTEVEDSIKRILPTSEPSFDELLVESTEEDMALFTFNDAVVETFKKQDAAAMSTLIVDRNELLLKECM